MTRYYREPYFNRRLMVIFDNCGPMYEKKQIDALKRNGGTCDVSPCSADPDSDITTYGSPIDTADGSPIFSIDD